MTLPRRLGAEFIGTFWLVLGGCGSAVLAAGFPDVGIGPLGVSLAFGLTVLTMAYALGHISGGHFNPAVTVGLWLGRRVAARDVAPYIGAQVAAANTSVNPARSTGPALFVGGWALAQLWLFWLAPLVGAAIAGVGYRYLVGDDGRELIAGAAQDTVTARRSAGDLTMAAPPARGGRPKRRNRGN